MTIRRFFSLPVSNQTNASEIHRQMRVKVRSRVIALFNYFFCIERELETGNETEVESVNCEPVSGILYGNRSGNMDRKRNFNLRVRLLKSELSAGTVGNKE